MTRLASKLLAKHAALSLDSLSHWALVVVDRGEGTCYLYDLMSDQMLPTTKIMRNYPRCFPVTEQMVESWTGASYIGETTRSHDEILEMGKRVTIPMNASPIRKFGGADVSRSGQVHIIASQV